MAEETRADKKTSPLVGLTAQEAVAELGQIDTGADERAREAGVKDAAYIDYNEALVNYENRSDIEFLGERRAREFPAHFSDTDFRREENTGTDNTGLFATDTVGVDGANGVSNVEPEVRHVASARTDAAEDAPTTEEVLGTGTDNNSDK